MGGADADRYLHKNNLDGDRLCSCGAVRSPIKRSSRRSDHGTWIIAILTTLCVSKRLLRLNSEPLLHIEPIISPCAVCTQSALLQQRDTQNEMDYCLRLQESEGRRP